MTRITDPKQFPDFEDNPLLNPESLAPLQILHLEDSDIDAAIFKAADRKSVV